MVFTLSSEIILENNIGSGKTISRTRLNFLLKKQKEIEIKSKIFHLLAYRERSRKELEVFLVSKGYDIENINKCLDALETKGYIDDERFSRTFATNLIKQKFLGKSAVFSKFRKHCISSDIIDSVINNLYLKYPADTLIKQLIEKKCRKIEKPIQRKDKIKLGNFLKRKGHSWEDICPIIDNLS